MKIKCCKTNLLAVQDTMDILKGRWKVQIIAALCYDKMRFSDLQKEIEGISAKMLSSELKDLEINQLVTPTRDINRKIFAKACFAGHGSTRHFGCIRSHG